jgi:hypothetical protein
MLRQEVAHEVLLHLRTYTTVDVDEYHGFGEVHAYSQHVELAKKFHGCSFMVASF